MGTKWSTGSSIWTWGRTSSLWGWRSTGTGCPGRLWSLLLWSYSRPAWTRSSTAYCRWLCFGRGGWTRWPTEVPSNPYHSVILWFCDTKLYSQAHLLAWAQHQADTAFGLELPSPQQCLAGAAAIEDISALCFSYGFFCATVKVSSQPVPWAGDRDTSIF